MSGKARSGPPRGRVLERERLSRALIELCYEGGFAAVTATGLCERAGVPAGRFGALYADLEDCFYETYVADYRIYLRMEGKAKAQATDWRGRVRATAYALYRFLATSPERRHFHMIELRAHPRALLVQEQGIQKMFDLIDEGRQEMEDPDTLTRATAEVTGGGIFAQIFMAAGRGGEMPPEEEIVPKMMYAAVLPYLGPEAAAEELQTPPPPFDYVGILSSPAPPGA